MEFYTELEKDLKKMQRIIKNLSTFSDFAGTCEDDKTALELMNIGVDEAVMDLKELYCKISGQDPWEVWPEGVEA